MEVTMLSNNEIAQELKIKLEQGVYELLSVGQLAIEIPKFILGETYHQFCKRVNAFPSQMKGDIKSLRSKRQRDRVRCSVCGSHKKICEWHHIPHVPDIAYWQTFAGIYKTAYHAVSLCPNHHAYLHHVERVLRKKVLESELSILKRLIGDEEFDSLLQMVVDSWRYTKEYELLRLENEQRYQQFINQR